MKKLTKSEWLGVALALFVVVYLFMGGMIASLFTNNNSTNMNDNAKNPDSITPPVTSTTSTEPAVVSVAGSLVTVHYVGKLADGRVFDSSRERGQPFSFVVGVGQVIKGWDTGLIGVTAGDKKALVIKPAEAYGNAPEGHELKNETLYFDIEVIDVKNQ